MTLNNDLCFIGETQQEILKEISSVALLSPACFFFSLSLLSFCTDFPEGFIIGLGNA